MTRGPEAEKLTRGRGSEVSRRDFVKEVAPDPEAAQWPSKPKVWGLRTPRPGPEASGWGGAGIVQQGLTRSDSCSGKSTPARAWGSHLSGKTEERQPEAAAVPARRNGGDGDGQRRHRSGDTGRGGEGRPASEGSVFGVRW